MRTSIFPAIVAAMALAACSTTTITMPTFLSGSPTRQVSESTARATVDYQQCARRAAASMPSWNPRGITAMQATMTAIDLCKAKEQQLYDVVVEDNRLMASPQAHAEAYVKGVREQLVNALGVEFLQMRR